MNFFKILLALMLIASTAATAQPQISGARLTIQTSTEATAVLSRLAVVRKSFSDFLSKYQEIVRRCTKAWERHGTELDDADCRSADALRIREIVDERRYCGEFVEYITEKGSYPWRSATTQELALANETLATCESHARKTHANVHAR